MALALAPGFQAVGWFSRLLPSASWDAASCYPSQQHGSLIFYQAFAAGAKR
jgi:hypothetical protein